MTARWFPEEGQWVALAKLCRAAGTVGWDSETEGHDPRKTSPHGRARVVVWSLALAGRSLHPRGYRRATGCTLPLAAMLHPALRGVLEDPGVVKVAHNAGYDEHSARNHGIRPRGVVNTLTLVRLVLPWRDTFGLKALMPDCLGRAPMGKFKDLFSRPRHGVRTKTKKMREVTCSCGEAGCRKRKGHAKEVREWTDTWEEQCEMGTELTPLSEIAADPGHPMFPVLVQYAAEDAEAALELHDWLHRQPSPGPAGLPW